MNINITPTALNGTVRVPSSKSLCHRAVIAAALSNGDSSIYNVNMSKDIEATIEAVKALGAEVQAAGDVLKVRSISFPQLQKDEIFCGESGSTLRFLIPLALLQKDEVTFTGTGRLSERPLTPYVEIFKKQGIEFGSESGLPLKLKGELKNDTFEIQGNISSQFITGLLFALPVLEGDSKIVITSELESKPYISLTLDVLKKFSINIQNNEMKEFLIKGNQSYITTDYKVEGDFSQAAFWLCAGALGGKITCCGMNLNSIQGDAVIVSLLKNMGAAINSVNDCVTAEKSNTRGITIDASECPDLVPILAVLGALSEGTTKIINAGRLRIKESDRLKAISTELNKIGADITEKEDSLIINGKPYLKGGTVEGWNDHRIVMALAVASIRCKTPVVINGCQAINKSYPGFFEDFKKLGGKIDERNLG